MEPQHKDDGEREFAERVLSVLTGRLPVPEEVYRITTAQLQRDRQRRRQQREGAEAAEEGGEVEEEEEEEEQAGDDRLYIKDRSLCGSARQRELVVQYLQWVLLRELALPAAAIERQSWTKHFNDGLALRLTNLVVSFPGLQQLDSSADDAPAPERPGDIVVGAHHDVQNNMSHCWMPSESTRSSAKDLRGHHDHHHHQDHDDEVKQGEEEGEGGGDADEYVVTAGADDNGSGVVGCLVLVRRLARQTRDPSEAGWRPRHTIRVALFDGEEPGLRCSLTEGSAEFVRRSTVKGAERPIDFALVIDMIGAPPSDPSVGLVLSHQDVDKDWLRTCAAAATPEMLVTPADSATRKPRGVFCLYASDSRIFAAERLPVVLMCNTHLGALPPFYHNELDTIDNIDWAFLLRCVDLAEALVKSRDAGESS